MARTSERSSPWSDPVSVSPSVCPFGQLNLELLDRWLAWDGDVLFSYIQCGLVPHIRVEVLRHDFLWEVSVHFDSQAAYRGESVGAISASMLTSSTYGVPPVPEFGERFNGQGLNTHLTYAWTYCDLFPGNMFHLLFKSERHFQLDEPISRADAIGLVVSLVDDAYLGTLATGMRWIFSREGAL